MPIIADRMRLVLDAATVLLTNYRILRGWAIHSNQNDEMIKALRDGDINHLRSLYDGLVDNIIAHSPSAEVVEAIVSERAHFNIRKKANDRAAYDMRVLRDKRRIEVETRAEIEVGLTGLNIEIDMTILHRRCFAFWKSSCSDQYDLIVSANIEDILKEMGLHSQPLWTKLINKMVDEGRLIPDRYPGSYTVAEPPQAALSDPEPTPPIPIPIPETENLNPTKPEALLPAFRQTPTPNSEE